MRKFAKRIIILIAIATGLMIVFISFKFYNSKEIPEQIQSLPPFAFNDYKTDAIFTDNNIHSGKAILIVYFHPECDFCQHEAEQISKHIDGFKDCQILFVSNAVKDSIASFAKTFKLSNQENVLLLLDKDFTFDDIFGKTGTPSSFLYNKRHKLLKNFKGFVKVDEILKYIE